MATKPPSEVKQYPEDTLEVKAYRSVDDIPTREPNDRMRLGYHVWRWLKDESTSLDEQMKMSSSRLLTSTREAKEMIVAKLKEQGVDLTRHRIS